MELMDIIGKRQSIRKYKPGDIPNVHIEYMIEAGRLSPSGKNIQNWYFIAIKNKSLKCKIADAICGKSEQIALKMDKLADEKGARFRKFVRNFTLFFLDAPLLFVVMTTDYHPSGYHELKLINADPDVLNKLVYKANPGMQSLGAAIEHVSLRAVELGYGVCWLTSANYASKEIEAVIRKETGFNKENFFLGALLSVGIPADGAKSPPRKDLSEIFMLIE